MLWTAIKLATKAIFTNALRSSLTVLGVVIGVAAVIAMVTMGQGASARVATEVSALGSNLLLILPGQSSDSPGAIGTTMFNDRDPAAIATQISGISAATPYNVRPMTAIFSGQNHSTSVAGTDNDLFVTRDWDLEKGRQFYESELRSGSATCIIGKTVHEELFGNGDPIDETIRLGQISCRIVGLLEEKGGSALGANQDDVVLIPIRTFQRRIAGNRDINLIYAAVRDGYATEDVIEDINLLMRERRNLSLDDADNFEVFDMKQVADLLGNLTSILTGLLAAVAAVSLLVGGIGIMNIMLVSVSERTKEIGIRLAIGAQERQVLTQFLVEAIVLSLFGGFVGILLGLGLAAIASSVLALPFIVDPIVIVGAFAFSAFIGVIFGFFPARRAARLDPIDALRHE